jgi:hypothetical protein
MKGSRCFGSRSPQCQREPWPVRYWSKTGHKRRGSQEKQTLGSRCHDWSNKGQNRCGPHLMLGFRCPISHNRPNKSDIKFCSKKAWAASDTQPPPLKQRQQVKRGSNPGQTRPETHPTPPPKQVPKQVPLPTQPRLVKHGSKPTRAASETLHFIRESKWGG